MFKPTFPSLMGRQHWRIAVSGLLAVLFCLLLAGVAVASPSQQGPDGADTCSSCHWPETSAWRQSPHAAEGVACETCHGAYVPEHPELDVMQLRVDSATCKDCHVDTTGQWQDSKHAQANVQCIGCHASHSQTTRLSADTLCGACHSEEIHSFTHTSHHAAGVTCIACHASATTAAAPGTSHQFTVIDAHACLDCHSGTIHEQVITGSDGAQFVALQQRAQDLTTRLDQAEQSNRLLRASSVIGLGLGVGIGGILGVIFILGISYISNRGVLFK